MMVVDQGLPARWPKLRPAGKVFAVIFSISVVISAITGGNLFQAWNVGDVTESYFGVPAWMCGLCAGRRGGPGDHRRHPAHRAGRIAPGSVHGGAVLPGLHRGAGLELRADSRILCADFPRRLLVPGRHRRVHRRHGGRCIHLRDEARALFERSRPGFLADRALRGAHRRAGARRHRCRAGAVHRHAGGVHADRSGDPEHRAMEARAGSRVLRRPRGGCRADARVVDDCGEPRAGTRGRRLGRRRVGVHGGRGGLQPRNRQQPAQDFRRNRTGRGRCGHGSLAVHRKRRCPGPEGQRACTCLTRARP